MKVLIDLSTFNVSHAGGKDEVVYNLLRGFSKLGLADDIICVSKKELLDNIKKIDRNYRVICINRHIFGSKIGPFLTNLFDREYSKKLNQIIKKESIDIVFFTNKFAPIQKINSTTLLLPHDIQPIRLYEKNRSLYNWLCSKFTKRNIETCDNIIAISDFDNSEMVNVFPWSKNKIYRIYNPIRFQEFHKYGDMYITMLNVQWKHKNLITVIKAFSLIFDKIDQDLMLIGKKPDNYDEIKLEIEKLGLSNRVHFTGFVSIEEMNNLLMKTRVYINSSFYEGFGMTAIEMMGAGIPTIVAANTAMPEVTKGMCRYYSPTDDYQKLADQILEELNNPFSSTKLKEISCEMINEYEYSNVAQKYWNLFEQIITAKK